MAKQQVFPDIQPMGLLVRILLEARLFANLDRPSLHRAICIQNPFYHTNMAEIGLPRIYIAKFPREFS